MIVINAETISSLLPSPIQQSLIRDAFLIAGDTDKHINPLRHKMMLKGNESLMGMMPGWSSAGNHFGIKLVNIFPDNPQKGFSSHMGAMLLFDGETGVVNALLDTARLTAIRTAAASAFATDLLATSSVSKLGIIGTGEQALSHIHAHMPLRDFDAIYIAGRSKKKAEAFINTLPEVLRRLAVAAENAQDLCEKSDVICTVTSSPTPVVKTDWLKDGQHINIVGASVPSKMEVEASILKRTHYYSDYVPSLMAEAGEVNQYQKKYGNAEALIKGSISDILLGIREGRQNPLDVTAFRSLGFAVEDLVFAEYLYRQCSDQSLGIDIPF
ncbi:ornithine cyclodeaminase family protein [Temperatibacter marinus]|uniref:Ornithine cyclodeaminase family protein n=1 Tax=Temperatibacter marinus TaxID=1456591 RepID=A0AA52HBA3_9PROT|nr:ornithine cyclodeaminase family protein [Temperatibacter marinus]WND03560.1 ornithine cyclodeaminase family protein [Temperatibacter marinus]